MIETETNYPYSFSQKPNPSHSAHVTQVMTTFLIGSYAARVAAAGEDCGGRAGVGEQNVKSKWNTTAAGHTVRHIHMPVEASVVDIGTLLSSPLSLVHTFPQVPVASLPAAIHDVSHTVSTRTNQLVYEFFSGCFERLVCWDQLGTSSQPQQCQAP
jgi:hypothetical protein